MGAACSTGCPQQGLAGPCGPTTLAEDSLWPALHQPSGQVMTKTPHALQAEPRPGVFRRRRI